MYKRSPFLPGDCAGDETQQFINSNVGNQLLRMAIQKTVGDLCLAHKLWDMLIEQVAASVWRTGKVTRQDPIRAAGNIASGVAGTFQRPPGVFALV